MYLPTISQEAMHQTSACVLAALFYHLLSNREKKLPLYIIILSMIGLFLISLIRVSWAILFLPFFRTHFPRPLALESNIYRIVWVHNIANHKNQPMAYSSNSLIPFSR
jgi:hypothetical protein